jgi:terminase small subunit / prophage DNA-packing protein
LKSDLRESVVTAAVLADLLAVSPRTIADLGKRGVVVKQGVKGYRLRESVRGYAEYLRKALADRGDAATAASAAKERSRLLKEQADAQAIKNATARGELLAANEVVRKWSDILRTVRDRLLALPGRVATQIPHLKRSDTAILDREIRDALTELSDGC